MAPKKYVNEKAEAARERKQSQKVAGTHTGWHQLVQGIDCCEAVVCMGCFVLAQQLLAA